MKRILLPCFFILYFATSGIGQIDQKLLDDLKSSPDAFNKSRIDYYINQNQLNPEDYEGYYSRGMMNFENGLYEKAIKDFRHLIFEQPDIVGGEEEIPEPYFYIGLCKAQLNEPDSAMYYFNKTLELNPAHADAYNERGILKLIDGNYSEAIKDFELAVMYNQQLAQAYYNIGYAHYMAGDQSSAKKALKKMKRNYPDFEWTYLLLGNIYMGKAKFVKAKKYFTQALDINPEMIIAYYHRGLADLFRAFSLYNQSYLNLAYYDFRKVTDLDSTIFEAWEIRSLIDGLNGDDDGAITCKYYALYYKLQIPEISAIATPFELEFCDVLGTFASEELTGDEKIAGRKYLITILKEKDEDDAKKHIEFLLTIDGSSTFGKQLLLIHALQKNDDAKIKQLIGERLAEDSTSIHLQSIKAELLCKEGKTGKGIALLHKLIDERPDYLYLQLLLGAKLYEVEKYDEAIEHLTFAIDKSPTYIDALYERARTYIKTENFEAAQKDVRQLIKHEGNNKKIWLLAGYVYDEREEPDSAIRALDVAIGIDPWYVDAYNKKALIYKNMSKTEEAYEVYRKLIWKFQNTSIGYFFRARFSQYQMDDPDYALKDYEKALSYKKDGGFIYSAIGELYLDAYEDYEEAKQNFQQAMFLDTSMISPILGMGRCYYHQEEYEHAAHYFNIALNKDTANTRAMGYLAMCYIELDTPQLALRNYQRICQIDSANASALGNIGWCYYLLNDFEKCIQYSQSTVKSDSTSYFAMANIALSHLRLGETELAQEEYDHYLESSGAEEDYDHSGAIEDLQGLIGEGIMVEEARDILINYFGVEE